MARQEPSEQQKRQEALERAVAQIEKQYGKGTVMRLGAVPRVRVPTISTGSLSLDLALGIGGIPRGRVAEIFGPEGAGKTTLALHIIANAQKQEGGIGAFVDAEHAFDAEYAEKLGVQLDNLLVSQPDSGEQALEVVEMLVRSNAVDAIAIDSVAALVPRAEIEGEMGDAFVGLQARLMSQALRKLTGAISKACTAVLFVNQIREKIGIMYGNPETTPGGRALKFYASVRIEVRSIGGIKVGDQVIGNRIRAKVVKNKMAAPFKSGEFDLIFNHGISLEGDVLDLATKTGLVDKSGTWLSYGQVRLGQGRESARQFLIENPDMLKELECKLRTDLGIAPLEVSPSEAASEPAQPEA
jgi:recombination protein RecA